MIASSFLQPESIKCIKRIVDGVDDTEKPARAPLVVSRISAVLKAGGAYAPVSQALSHRDGLVSATTRGLARSALYLAANIFLA